MSGYSNIYISSIFYDMHIYAFALSSCSLFI